MRRALILTAFTLIFASARTQAQVSTWEIDPAHTMIGFSVKHLMVSNVRGTFNTFSGTVQGREDDVTSAVVDVTIDVGSIDTREPKRDQHLRSADFFDVAKYPSIVFHSKKVTKTGPGTLRVTGDLTIHGVTKEVVLDVDGLTPPMKDPWGNQRVGAHASTKISRKDFGLLWNQALDTGGVVVGDEVSISIDVEMFKKAASK